MPGTFSPAADFKGNRLSAIPACITARASRTCRDACRDRLPADTGKTFPAFPAHAHPQFCVFGKRPMIDTWPRSRDVSHFSWIVFVIASVDHRHDQSIWVHSRACTAPSDLRIYAMDLFLGMWSPQLWCFCVVRLINSWTWRPPARVAFEGWQIV